MTWIRLSIQSWPISQPVVSSRREIMSSSAVLLFLATARQALSCAPPGHRCPSLVHWQIQLSNCTIATVTIITSNDNWRSDQEAEILATGLAPADDAESAIVATLAAGSYTAIVRGSNNTTGVALIEIYQLKN